MCVCRYLHLWKCQSKDHIQTIFSYIPQPVGELTRHEKNWSLTFVQLDPNAAVRSRNFLSELQYWFLESRFSGRGGTWNRRWSINQHRLRSSRRFGQIKRFSTTGTWTLIIWCQASKSPKTYILLKSILYQYLIHFSEGPQIQETTLQKGLLLLVYYILYYILLFKISEI